MNNKKESLGKLSCFSRASRKKGISAIVATVLIILITVAAVTIIWAAIIPMINNQLESGTVCLDAVSAVSIKDEGYTCVNTTVNSGGAGNFSVKFQVARNAKDFDLAALQVLVSVGGDTSTITKDASSLLANGVVVFNVSGATFNESTQIQIAPIISVGATQETCDVAATKVLTPCS